MNSNPLNTLFILLQKLTQKYYNNWNSHSWGKSLINKTSVIIFVYENHYMCLFITVSYDTNIFIMLQYVFLNLYSFSDQILYHYSYIMFHVWVLNRVWLCATPWTVARQAPLSVEILQARILEWVAISSSRRSSWPRDWTPVSWISSIGKWILYYWIIWEAPYIMSKAIKNINVHWCLTKWNHSHLLCQQ